MLLEWICYEFITKSKKMGIFMPLFETNIENGL